MNNFEKIYEEVSKQCDTQDLKALAKAMYEKGMDESLTELLKKFSKNFMEAIPLLQWVGYTISEQSVNYNAYTLSINQKVLINDKKYHSWLQVLTFSDGEMNRINRMAKEKARQMLDSTPICDIEHVLTQAILTGYNMGKAEPEEYESEDYKEEEK